MTNYNDNRRNNSNSNRPYRGRNNYQRPPRKDGPTWEIIETKVKNNAAVQVSELPLQVPRYSFRAGTASFDERTGELEMKPFLTGFNVMDAADLLKEMGEKYNARREEALDRMNRIRKKWENSEETEDNA